MGLSIGMVTIDCSDPQSLAEFWTATLGTTVAGDYGEFVFLAGTPGLGLQKVAEPRAGKNRVHLDLAADDRAAEVARLSGLGASVLAEHSAPGLWWTVLTDPEGNEFCVCSHHG
ncbi:MAG: glyoxalase [Pseudonocardiales bacterium]|nr:MAG: glyoxalase [Pseudonocardiales bacterium]